MATIGNVIGRVAVLQGQAFVRGQDGSQRLLKVGDVVREGEAIVTGPNSHVELAFEGGQTFLLREQETVTLDKTVFGTDLPEGRDAALLGRVTEAADITRALAEGSSLDDLLEETSAGLSGGAGNDGHNFVELLRIVETVPPASYEYGTGRGYVLPGLVGSSARPDAPPPVETVNNAPVANPDANRVMERVDNPAGSTTSGNVLTAAATGDRTDTDIDGDSLSVTTVKFGTTTVAAGSTITTAYGKLVVNGDGSYTYTLDNANPAVNSLNVGNTLTEQVTYTVSDGHGGTASTTLTITIDGANDAPTATVGAPIIGTEDGVIHVPLSGTDPDSPIAYVTVTALPPLAQGVLYKPDGTPAVAGDPIPVDPVTGQVMLTFVPAPNYNGPVDVKFTVTDPGGLVSPVATQSITVTPVNDAPVANDDVASTPINTVVDIDVKANDSDPDNSLAQLTVSN
ncbi:MAG TPA: retention module-containing protein, partial [Rhodocyclaceae bacterium]|nr:retention module-containing protein [Rhodocyclaceae bacterium]